LVHDRKQLIIRCTDPVTKCKISQNAPLYSAINLHRVNEETRFRCLQHKDVTHYSGKRAIQNGLVFVQPDDLLKLDEEMLKLMCSSQAIVTSNAVKSKELFVSIVKVLTDEEEKDEKERKDWKPILNCIILTISEDDFKRIQSKFEVKPEWLVEEKSKKDPLSYYLAQLEKWGQVDIEKVL